MFSVLPKINHTFLPGKCSAFKVFFCHRKKGKFIFLDIEAKIESINFYLDLVCVLFIRLFFFCQIRKKLNT